MTDTEMFEHLQSKAYDIHALFQVEIDVTSACNAQCPFCFQGLHKKVDEQRLSLERMIELLEELRELGTYYIGFSGGEPFMRHDFLEILTEAKKRLFRVSLITNGMLLDEEKIERIASLGVDRVTVSFHSCVPENYCKCFGISDYGMIEKVSKSIELLQKKGVSTGIATTVTNINIGDINKTKQFLEKLGINGKDINYNMLLSGKSNVHDLLPGEEDILSSKEYLQTKVSGEQRRKLQCSAGLISCSIDSRGNVYPCTFFNTSVGNICEKSLKEIWYNSHLLNIIRSFNDDMYTKCKDCTIREKCGLCIATNLNETQNVFLPPHYFCEARKARLGVI